MRKGTLDASVDEAFITNYFAVDQVDGLLDVPSGQTRFSPGDRIYAIVEGRNGERILRSFFWGWNPVNKSLHACKVETASLKNMWKDAYEQRRCIVPFSAVSSTEVHQPMRAPGHGVMAVAGIYDAFQAGVAILTTAARGELGDLRDRQPLIVPLNLVGTWLDRDNHEPDLLRRVINNESPYLQLAL